MQCSIQFYLIMFLLKLFLASERFSFTPVCTRGISPAKNPIPPFPSLKYSEKISGKSQKKKQFSLSMVFLTFFLLWLFKKIYTCIEKNWQNMEQSMFISSNCFVLKTQLQEGELFKIINMSFIFPLNRHHLKRYSYQRLSKHQTCCEKCGNCANIGTVKLFRIQFQFL